MPRPRSRAFRIAAAALALSLIAGSAIALTALAPLFRSTDHFLAFAGDARVRYEPGAEAAAAVIAGALPDAITAVERGHFRPFAKPVAVHVCATLESFERYRFGAKGAGGFVLNGRLFISPKPENTAERLPRLLRHELSHLHLEQQLGMIRHARMLPGWFKEGLAVHVSGSGAENVSAAEARNAIALGRVFRRDIAGSLRSPQTPVRDGLAPHLFYREAALFVGFLHRRDPAAFVGLLRDLQDGRALRTTLLAHCGRDLDRLWAEFLENVGAPREPSPRSLRDERPAR